MYLEYIHSLAFPFLIPPSPIHSPRYKQFEFSGSTKIQLPCTVDFNYSIVYMISDENILYT